jgi:predicted acylesterase/phospholipase RssA
MSGTGARPSCALSLPGGGLTGALYQVGALAALEDGVLAGEGQRYSAYIGSSSGASVAAALAGGITVDRLYRALLDPVDNFFPLDRSHVLRLDLDEWRRALSTGFLAARHALARVVSRSERASATPAHLFLWEQLDRLNDSLPAGLFRLDRYERLLAEVFLRRGIPNDFRSMPTALRVAAHDLDSGERAVFGAPATLEGARERPPTPDRTHVPVSLACAASLALPLFFSPVRIDGRHYLDGGLGHVAHLDVAGELGASLAIVVNPLVPVTAARGAIPTGHGARGSVRDKGLLWVFNQSMRIGAHARLHQEVARATASGMHVLVLEPEPTDVVLFLHNPVNFDARRAILEYAYRTTRERIAVWIEKNRAVVDRFGWKAA